MANWDSGNLNDMFVLHNQTEDINFIVNDLRVCSGCTIRFCKLLHVDPWEAAIFPLIFNITIAQSMMYVYITVIYGPKVLFA